MWFNDKVVIGDTSSPTTYELDGALDPNVGQYGWTKSDQGHYNQLVAYVNDCRKYYEDTAVIGGYAQQAIKELVRIEGILQYVSAEVERVEAASEQIGIDTDRANVYNNSVTTMYRAIQLLVDEVRKKYDEIVIIGAQADQDAEDAKTDATKAAEYYLRTKEMYDEWKAANP